MKNSKLFKSIFYFLVGVILLIANVFLFNTILGLIREPSDLLVGLGVYGSILVICIDVFLVVKLYERVKKLFVFVGLLIAVQACTKIDAGYEGIRIQQYGSDKGVQDDPTISIRITPGAGPMIYRKYRKDIEEVIKITVFNYVKDAYRIVFNESVPDHIISARKQLEDSVQNYLTRELEKEGFHLEQLTSGIAYPQSITEAINAKETAVQKALEAENQLKLAEAQAKIKVVNAEAEAQANRSKQNTLTPQMIQAMFIDKWDGHTPLYGQGQMLLKDLK
jgi:hypothetical protein